MSLRNLLVGRPRLSRWSESCSAGDWAAAPRQRRRRPASSDEKLPDKLVDPVGVQDEERRRRGGRHRDGVVYAGSADKRLYAIDLDLKTGPGRSGRRSFGHPARFDSPGYKDGKVYIGDDDGKFYCLDAADGSVLWTFETEGQITAAPNFDGDNILIPSHDSTLYCLDKDGKKIWDFRIEGPIYGGVAVADGKTFLAGCDSLMHVLDVEDRQGARQRRPEGPERFGGGGLRRPALRRHDVEPGAGDQPEDAPDRVGVRGPEAEASVLRVGGRDERPRRDRQPGRQGLGHRPQDRQASLGFPDRPQGGRVGGDRRRSRVRRLVRPQVLRAWTWTAKSSTRSNWTGRSSVRPPSPTGAW